jgi:phage/plasmid primase-like uncharacterized protein
MGFLHEFEQAMRNDGIYPSCALEATREIKRIQAKGDKSSTRNIAYWFVDEGNLAYGWYQHWGKTDGKGWVSRKWNTVNSQKRKEIQEKFEEARKEEKIKRKQQYEESAIEAQKIWNNANPYENHPALLNKGFSLNDSDKRIEKELMRLKIKSDDKSVLIPVFDEANKLWTLQRLLRRTDEKPNKMFLKDGKSGGCFYVIGGNFNELSGQVAIAEGFTTGLSVHLALDIPVIVTFSADNMLKICSSKFMLEKGLQFIICGDDDRFGKENKGREKATEARNKLGCKLVFPVFKNLEKEPSDWNDLHLLEGLETVREQILKAMSSLNVAEVSDMPLGHLSEKEKPIYISKLIISKIDTCFNELSTKKSYLKFKNEKRFYECGSSEFFVRIAGEYSAVFGESTSTNKEISRLVEHYLKSEENGVIWIEASKPVYLKDEKVFFKTDLKDYPIYEIDKDGFRVSAEKDYTAFKNFVNKKDNEIVFTLSKEKATLPELEMFYTVKGMDLIKILAFCMSSIFSKEKYILGIFGPFGSGKDYVQTRIQETLSPLELFNRMMPSTKRDLMVVSSQTFVNGYSNISFISKEYQDYFCLLVSETSDPARQLFSDNTVVNIKAQTPIVLNGINNIIEREDLLSRMMIINLERMSSDTRIICKSGILKELQGKAQHFIFSMISWFLVNIDEINKEMALKNRTEKLALWMYYCSRYAEMDFTIKDFHEDQEKEFIDNIMSNPIFMAIENYFTKSNKTTLRGSVTEVWESVKNWTDVGYLKNMLPHHFMREVNRIDFSKTHINFISSGKKWVNGRCQNQICFEVSE